MTTTEPERLALELQRLIEQRTKLRELMQGPLHEQLTANEQAQLRQALDHVETEISVLQARLDTLVKRPRSGN